MMAKASKKKVIIGGTFETLHKGHLALFKRAFELGEVLIGLTSDKMAERQRKRKVKDFKERKRDLEGFLQKEFFPRIGIPPETATIKPKIVKIEDKFGPALKGDFDYIIVSPETEKTAVMLNKKRIKRGKKPLKIVKIGFVLAEDGKPISDSRILKGEIDSEGKICI